MPPTDTAQHRRFALRYYLIAGIITLAAVAAAIAHFQPSLTRAIVMTTGTPGGSYDLFALRYKVILAREGVALRLVPSGGSVENLSRLSDPHSGVDCGFIDGGLVREDSSPELMSLGAMFYEPAWFFYRGVDPGPHLEGLRGRKIAIGPEGSSTRVVALRLLALHEINAGAADLLPLSAQDSGERLLSGEIDAAIMMMSWDAPIVRRLLADPQIELLNFPRAEAITALYPYLTKLIFPAGAGNLAAGRPPADTNLFATKASLIVRSDCPPALQFLLLQAASQIHSQAGVFQKSSQFPAPEQVDLPLSRPALQFYKSGVPFLQNHLPFWLAELSGILLVVLIPVVGVLYPLLRFLPGAYVWSMRRRVFRLYSEVKLIEMEMESDPTKSAAEMLLRLDNLESRAMHMRVSFMFAQLIYHLRQHMNLVRGRLEKRAKDGESPRDNLQPYG